MLCNGISIKASDIGFFRLYDERLRAVLLDIAALSVVSERSNYDKPHVPSEGHHNPQRRYGISWYAKFCQKRVQKLVVRI